MNMDSVGVVEQIKPLSEHYTLVQIGLAEAAAIKPGSRLEIDGWHYEVMSISRHSNTLQLLTYGASVPFEADETIHLTAVGTAFTAPESSRQLLLLGENLGMAPVICAAQQFKRHHKGRLTALLGFDNQLPFRPAPSQMLLPMMPPHVTGAVPLLEEWGVISRVAHTEFTPGCLEGDVIDLLTYWLAQVGTAKSPRENTTHNTGDEIEILAAVSEASAARIKALAEEHQLPCQIRIV